jgi:hypothetical protein
MLDQLIESKNHSGENRRREGFLLSTFTAAFSVLTFALIYSLFSYNLVMGSEKLEMSALVLPVSMPDVAPEPPKPAAAAAPKRQNTETAITRLPTRAENIQRPDEVPRTTPTDISTTPNKNLSRPDGAFKIGPDYNPPAASGNRTNGRDYVAGDKSAVGIAGPKPEVSKETEDDVPPPPVKIPAPKAVKAPAVIKSRGVLNGQALNLVKPVYPLPAKAIRAGGAVNVQVLIDENGTVTSASAISGHPLLRQVSEQAARSSKFSSTLLGDQKVKVTGVIVYNFVPQ